MGSCWMLDAVAASDVETAMPTCAPAASPLPQEKLSLPFTGAVGALLARCDILGFLLTSGSMKSVAGRFYKTIFSKFLFQSHKQEKILQGRGSGGGARWRRQTSLKICVRSGTETMMTLLSFHNTRDYITDRPRLTRPTLIMSLGAADSVAVCQSAGPRGALPAHRTTT